MTPDELIVDPSEEVYVPIDRREFDPSDYPHNPEAYHITDHFRDRFKTADRFLTDEIVARTIVEGELLNNGDGCAAFRWSRHNDGVNFWFIAGHHHDGYLIAVSAWPELWNREKALESGYWTEDEVEAIADFTRGGQNYRVDYEEWSDYIKWSQRHPHGGLAHA